MPSLPTEHSTPGSWRRVGATAATVAVVVGALNLGAERHLAHESPNWSHRMVEGKFGLVRRGAAPVDWLVLGDSSAAHGVVPATWRAQTGRSVLNLATVAGLGVAGDAWALQDYVDRVGPPGGVVLVHTLDAWDRPAQAALVGQVPRTWSERQALRPRPEWGPRAHLDQLTSRHLPLYAESGSLISSLFGVRLPAGLVFEMDPDGWVPSRPADPLQRAVDAERFVAGLGHGGLRPLDETVRALSVLGELCARWDLPLVVAQAPLLETVAGHPAVARRTAEVERLVETATAPARVVVLPAELQWEADALEATVDHLLPEAAHAYTRWLADRVEGVVGGVTPGGGGADRAGATPP